MASSSEFSRFEDRLGESVEKQIARLETRLEPLGHVVRDLALLEYRQKQADGVAKDVQVEISAMGSRFDGRVSDLGKAHQALEARVAMYVQRAVGVSAAVGALWAVATHYWK